jgi:glycosyltransferase involved in cell wall biosynthesis
MNRFMNVLHVLRYSPEFGGGIIQHLSSLGEAFAERRFGLSLAFPRHRHWFNDLPSHAEVFTLPQIENPLRSSFPFQVRKLIAEKNINILHLHFAFAMPFAMACVPGARDIPIVHHWHNPPRILLDPWTPQPAPFAPLKKHLSGYAARYADSRAIAAHVAISREIEDLLVENRWTTRDKVFRLPNALARVPEAVTGDVRRSSQGTVIGSVSNFRPQKDHETLLTAFRTFSGKHPGSHLVLVGDGPTRPRIEKLADRLGIRDRVEFAGETQDPDPYYRRFDLFVLSTHFEGHPLVLLEAMAHALPVVATDLPAIRETITNGKDGILTAPRDPEAIFRALDLLANDATLRMNMAAKGREKVLRQGKIGNWVERLIGFYEKLNQRGDIS